MKKFPAYLLLLPLLLTALLLASCTTAPPSGAASNYGWSRHEAGQDASPRSTSAAAPAFVSPPRSSKKSERPGLGTGWGEDRDSKVHYTNFTRGSKAQPWGTGRLYYNNQAGAEAMANQNGFSWRSSGPAELANRTVEVGLQSSFGRWLKSFQAGSDRFFVGDDGDRYQISIRNRTQSRIEVVVSVDGLDVMDGKSASESKRGYIIAPGADIEVEGFRQSTSRVAAFRFSSVSDSYSSQKHGSTRNVGVIGIAVYTEGGQNPWTSPDTALRRSADPFPGSAFATAP